MDYNKKINFILLFILTQLFSEYWFWDLIISNMSINKPKKALHNRSFPFDGIDIELRLFFPS